MSFEDMLDKQATILKAPTGQGTWGQPGEAWQPSGEVVWCGFGQVNGNEVVAINGVVSSVDALIIFDVASPVTRLARVVIDGITWELLSVVPAGKGHHQRARARQL